jgi:hypothetical protein
MRCRICNEEGWQQTQDEQAEPCLCGEMAYTSPWEWDRWRGIRKWLRYHCAAVLFRLGNRLITR